MRLTVAGEGALVLKVPGLAGGVGLFREAVAAARTAGFRVAALDPSGDRADDPAPGPLTWDALAGDVFRALDQLRAPSAILWGTSFGSLICLAAAARRPERVRGLLLCAPPEPGWRPGLHRSLLRWTSNLRRPERASALWFSAAFVLLNAWEFLSPVALSRLGTLAGAAFDARTPDRTIHEKLGLLLEDHPGLPPQPIDCAIVAGAWDLVTSPGAARRLAAALPGSRLHELGLCGHACAYSRPRAYRARAIEELRRLSAAPRDGSA
jgi:pimeloyl-ACP methyl ester carboxylesterase